MEIATEPLPAWPDEVKEILEADVAAVATKGGE